MYRIVFDDGKNYRKARQVCKEDFFLRALSGLRGKNSWPSATDLDSIAPNHPVYLTAKSLHAAWVNRRALQAAPIEIGTPNPPGGGIVRDGQGAATGILLEAAMSLVADRIPASAPEAIAQEIAAAQGSSGDAIENFARRYNGRDHQYQNNHKAL